MLPKNSQVEGLDFEVDENFVLDMGQVQLKVIPTLGHTNSHAAYYVNDTMVFTGDSLFINGCGRTDFQEGCPETMYQSIQKLFAELDDDVLVYPAHNYCGLLVSTIGEEKKYNQRISNKCLEEFVETMDNLNLAYPKKIDESLPANLKAGRCSDKD